MQILFEISMGIGLIIAIIYEDVKKVLKINLDERHIRGGEATKQKYLKEKR